MEPIQQGGAKRRPMAEINVVPYIDVMLVLLIIFMVTAPMLVQTVPVDLPDVESTPTDVDSEDNTLFITVSRDGLYYVERDEENPTPMTLLEVQDYASKLVTVNKDTRILIRGDDQVPYGRVVALMGSLQTGGITNVGLVTESPSGDTNEDRR